MRFNQNDKIRHKKSKLDRKNPLPKFGKSNIIPKCKNLQKFYVRRFKCERQFVDFGCR